jgi:prophage tail gpP-like protein/phage tail protein X
MNIPEQDGVYITQDGDYLRALAVKAYGNEKLWTKIWKANPGIVNPDLIYPGTSLYIPPEDEIQTAREEVRENQYEKKPKGTLTLIIDGREVPVKQARFGYGIDLLASSWNAEIAWTPGKDTKLDKATARGSFAPSDIYLGGQHMGSGRLYSRKNHIGAREMTKQLTFYSTTKDLVDSCLLPAMSEIKDSDLKQIADKILAANGIPVVFIDPPGPPFEVIQRDGVETVAKYFQRLASQRGLFVSCDERGRVVFQKLATAGKPAAHLEWNGRTATEYDVEFNLLRLNRKSVEAEHVCYGEIGGTGHSRYKRICDPSV